MTPGCLVNITTDCVTTTKTYTCIETAPGTMLTTVLDSIDAKLCAIPPPACQVKVTSSDACCDYLDSKITSSTLGISVVTDGTTGCQTLNIESPDLSCLGKVLINSTATCKYLANVFVAGSVIPQINGTGGSQTISFVDYSTTFSCTVANSTHPLPISSDSNGDVVCSNTYYNTHAFPAPTAVGVPVVGKAAVWTQIAQSPLSGSPIVTLGNQTFAADQGVTGTYACTFTLPQGIYDISLSYAITNGGASIGATGLLLFVLQDQAVTTNYYFPCKEVISCQAEQRAASSFSVSGVIVPTGGKTLLLRVQNSVAVFNGSTHENLTLTFKKVG